MEQILVVEDDHTDQLLIRAILAGAGYDVEFATDGKQALEILKARLPNLVLTKVQLLRMSGKDLVAEIRKSHPVVPVILLTALGDDRAAVQALKDGATSYVAKQSLKRDLASTVFETLMVAEIQVANWRGQKLVDGIELSLSLKTDLEMIQPTVQLVCETIEEANLWDKIGRMQVGMALNEALANAILHGNLELDGDLREHDLDAYYVLARERQGQELYRDRRVEVTVSLTKSGAYFVIRDQGAGFDPSKLPDPTDPMHLEKVRGRGLLLIRNFMDGVAFNDKANAICMSKAADTVNP